MASTGRGLMAIALMVVGFWAGAALAQPFPGGLPACLEELNGCSARLDTCTTTLTAQADDLATCTASLNSLATCTTDLNTCDTTLSACVADLSSSNVNLANCSTNLNTSNANLAACTTNLNACDASLWTCTTNLSARTADLATCTNELNGCHTSLETCNTDLNACQAALAAAEHFPATGQTSCWNSSGAAVVCTGTGQDGEIQAGATLSYTDNGNGTITDNNTKLVWEKKSDDGSVHDKDNTYSWANAFAVHIATLNAMNFAGYNDWRLPNVRELQSILTYGTFQPAVSAEFNNGCVAGTSVLTGSCTYSGSDPRHWTSTTAASSSSSAWAVYFDHGWAAEYSKVTPLFVRAVRGGF